MTTCNICECPLGENSDQICPDCKRKCEAKRDGFNTKWPYGPFEEVKEIEKEQDNE